MEEEEEVEEEEEELGIHKSRIHDVTEFGWRSSRQLDRLDFKQKQLFLPIKNSLLILSRESEGF